MRVAIAGLALALVGLEPALAAGGTVCQTAAAALKALPPPESDASSDLVEPPLQRAAAAPNAVIRLSTPDQLSADAVKGLPAVLTSQFNASPEVLKAVADLAPEDSDTVWLHTLPGTQVRVVEAEAGTADCETFAVFQANPGGQASVVPDPPQVAAARESDGSMAFCTTDEGLVGAVGATPVFVEQGWDPTDPVYDISFAPWTGSGWGAPCGLRVRYQRRYAVGEFHCEGAACAALRAAAPGIAEARQAQTMHPADETAPATFAYGPAPTAAERAQLARIKADLGDALDTVAVPILGQKGDIQHGFGDDAVVFALKLNGHAYAAVLGHGRIGWRLYPDYLLALYDLKGGKAVPVAGLVIDRRLAGPVSVQPAKVG